MPLIPTHEWQPGQFPQLQTDEIYNGLDTMVTLEVFHELAHLRNAPPVIYSFARALQAPALDMMARGFLVDQHSRRMGAEKLRAEIAQLEATLNCFAEAVWHRPLNPRSPKQLQEFFYRHMRLPEQWTSKKGERKLSMDREALEKLEQYFHAMPIVATILAIRERTKLLEVLDTEIDPDGRFRASYNIAGTETGRWSSSANAFGTGRNAQNITADLRHIFIADPGWKLCGIDLEQAESREVGWGCGVLFDDWSYLDACYSGDLHTTVCRMTWTELPWTDDPKANRKIAERPFYRHYTYRDMAKKLGHGSNYLGKPFTMARHAKIPVAFAQHFQERYFSAFPGIPLWHRWVSRQLTTTACIITPFGRERLFFGRQGDETTLREAIAYSPQSSTGDRLNLALYRIWRTMGKRIRLMAQVHDALYFQYREDDDEQEVISTALGLIETPMYHGTHKLVVPGEAKIGWNWGNYVPVEALEKWEAGGRLGPRPTINPNGLAKFRPGTPDARKRLEGLERVFT